ncbi:MAG: hypothetical protein ACPG7F_12105 [Aggregatilineales bacterium]
MIVFSTFSLMGMLVISIVLMLLARLSQKLGKVTHARPYFIGLYIAAFLFAIGTVLRFFFVNGQLDAGSPDQQAIMVILINGLPALAITIALLVMWFYWSWLLAERD